MPPTSRRGALAAGLALAVAGTSGMASAAEPTPRLQLTVHHTLAAARPAETIAVPWREVARQLPGARLHQLAVRDATGRLLPYQVTNVDPQAKDPRGEGTAYGELLFQHDFAAGEQQARFTIEKAEAVVPPFPARAFARPVPERLDDFAWENDRIAHRTYGPALAAPAPPGSGKEVLVSSGIDVWFKRPSYLVIDRWYTKGHDHYHQEQGEGLDMYGVGRSRGLGGSGLWNGQRLFTSGNYARWRILANGPIRVAFELAYDTWDADGRPVSELKRFTLDAGQLFTAVESRFTAAGPQPLRVALGLNKAPAYTSQGPVISTHRDADTLVQWVRQRSAGDFGTALILPGADGHADDALNELILATVAPGQPLRYHLGAAVSWSGEFTSTEAWQAYVAAWRERVAAPVQVRITPPAGGVAP